MNPRPRRCRVSASHPWGAKPTPKSSAAARSKPRAPRNARTAAAGAVVDTEALETYLQVNGYGRAGTVRAPGDFAIRGGVIDVFPPHHQDQTRIQLASTLQSVVAQQLIPMPGSQGRVVACEILIATPAVRKIVRSGKTEQLMTMIQTSYEIGMISMDKSLKNLYLQGLISFDDAISRCKFPESFEQI